MNDRVVLITGGSSGIGAATAASFASRGWRVFATSRAPDASSAAGVAMLPLEVRDDASVRACVAEVERRAGRLDALVNNAGTMLFGPVEEVPIDGARDLFDTNLFGAARMVNAALPLLRRSRGWIVNVGSIAGTAAIPMNGYYAATKHALAGYTEALRHEVRAFGVRVALVAPADFRTPLWSAAVVAPPRLEEYAPLRARVLGVMKTMRDRARGPEPVAERIVAIAESDDAPLHNPVGRWAHLLPRMKAWMPQRAFERGVRRRFLGEGF